MSIGRQLMMLVIALLVGAAVWAFVPSATLTIDDGVRLGLGFSGFTVPVILVSGIPAFFLLRSFSHLNG